MDFGRLILIKVVLPQRSAVLVPLGTLVPISLDIFPMETLVGLIVLYL